MMTWPNRITVLRILLLTPFLILLLNAEDYPPLRYWALGIFGLMALCDLLDGQIARRYRQRTRLGSMLDPLADKLVLTATLILLTDPGWLGGGNPFHIPVWATVTILSKDAVILLGVVILHFMTNRTEVIRPSVPGKAATALSFLLVLATLVAPDVAGAGLPRVMDHALVTLSGAAAAVSAGAGLDYIRRGSRMIAAHSGEEKV